MPPDPGFIVDAAPLIILARAGRLNFLTQLAPTVLVPGPVAREVLRGAANDPAVVALNSGFGLPTPVRYIPISVRRVAVLGRGESAVLALGLKHPTYEVVVDDFQARRSADALGLRKVGTLGLALRASKANLIPALRPVIRDLLNAGLYLDNRTITVALASVGETWP